MAKRIIDSIDIEAERESLALRRARQQQCKPFGFNKRTHKERKARRDGEFRQQSRIIRGIQIMLENQ
jgi:hypothetical protein